MLKLDNTLLEEIGLGSLPETQKRQMLQHIYDTLELRVGTQLANQMTDKQLEEFEKFIDSGGDANQAQALQWLEANLPNYKDVVQQTFDALKAEVKSMAPQLLASAAQQPQEAQIVSQPQTVTNQAPNPSMQQPYTPQMSQQQYAAPQMQPSMPPSPQQVMPSQQAPVDASQSWQQPMQGGQSTAPAYVQPQPYAPTPGVATQGTTPTASATDSFAQPQQSQQPFQTPPQSFAQEQPQTQDVSATTPPATPTWQPQPAVQPWQPQPPADQQPPQAA